MSRQWAQKKSGSNSSMLVQKSSSSQRPFTAPIYDAPAPQQTPSVQAKRRNVDWSRVTVEAQSPAGVQAKLSVGAPGDKYEQEADSMATKVMTMPDSAIQQPIQRQTEEETEAVQMQPLVNSITPLVQRSSGEEEEVQMKSGVQRASDGSSQASGSVENRLAGSKGGGSALPDDVRSFMEPRFGADFSGVRVHTDSNAVQMNKELGAQAFAHGSDIYYGAGKAPGNNELTAHELTHVVQQTGAVQTKEASNKPNVQLKCSACDEEAKVQKSLDISAVSKSEIQRWSLFGDDEEKEPENSSGGGILDWAKEKASGAVDSVSQAGGDAYDWAKEKGGAAVDTVTQAGGDAYDWAKEKGSAAVDTVTQAGSDAYDWAKEKGSAVADTVTQAGGDAYDWAKDKGGAALDLATDVGGQALDLMSNLGNVQVDWNSAPGRIVKAWASQLDPELVQNIRGKNPADVYNLVSVPAQVQQAAEELAKQASTNTAQSAAPTSSTSGAIQMYAPATAPAPVSGPVSTPGPGSGVYPVGPAPGLGASPGAGRVLLLGPIVVAIVVFLAIMLYSKPLNQHEDEYLKEDRKRDEEKRKKLKENLGDCTEEQHRTLQDEVDKQCKHEYPGKGVDQDKKGLKRSCDDETLDCAELRSRWQRNERCAKAREDVNEKCYKGGDDGHTKAAESARIAEEKCREQYRKKKC